MIKKSNSIGNPGWILIAQAFFILMVFAYIKAPAYASKSSTSKKPKLTSNFDQQDSIKSWFASYDQIRRQAQLSPAERQKADEIMGKGLSIFMPGADKVLAQNLLANLVKRYDVAVQQMASLPVIPATEQLHRAYYQYFVDARRLFSEYLKLQDDLLATDPSTGQPVASGLVERKENLAMLDENNKILDGRLRQQYSIPAYQYKPFAGQPRTLQYQPSNAPPWSESQLPTTNPNAGIGNYPQSFPDPPSSQPPILQYPTNPQPPAVGDFPPYHH